MGAATGNDPARLQAICDRFRSMVERPMDSPDYARFGPLAAEATALLEALERDPQDPHRQAPRPRAAHDLAWLLATLAERDQSGHQLAHCLGYWLAAGPLGWALAVRCLANPPAPFNLCRAVLDKLPHHARLLLANAHFAAPRESPPTAFGKWCAEALFGPPGKPPKPVEARELVLFLSKLRAAGQNATLQARAALLETGAQEALELSLLTPMSGTEFAPVAAAVAALDEPVTSEVLVKALQGANDDCLDTLLDITARADGESSQALLLLKVVGRFLSHPNPGTRLRAMLALSALRAPNMDKVFGFYFKKFKDRRRAFYHALTLLRSSEFKRLTKQLPEDFAADAVQQLFLLLARAVPGQMAGVLACLLGGVSPKDYANPAVNGARTLMDALAGERRHLPPPPPPKAAPPKADAGKKGLFGLGGKGKPAQTLLEEALDHPYDVDGLDLAEGTLSSLTIAKKTCKNLDLSGALCRDMVFEGVGFKAVRFDKAVLEQVVFRRCRLTDVSFAGAALSQASFEDCVLENVDFTDGAVEETGYGGCAMTGVRFDGARLDRCVMERTSLDRAALFGAVFEDCALCTLQARLADFSRAFFHRCSLQGFSLEDSVFDRAVFEHTRCFNLDLKNIHLVGCRFSGMVTDAPALLAAENAAERRALFAEAREGLAVPDAKGFQAPEWLATDAGFGLARRAVEQWFAFKDLRKRERIFLANNARRLDLTVQTLGPAGEFFLLLPYLLCTDVFERAKSPGKRYPLCRVYGYTPDKRVMDLAKKHFGEFAPPPEAFAEDLEEADGLPEVEAVYTIGSVGSIAMTAASDIDYWVCLKPSDAAKTKAALAEKLELISAWGDEVFDLETTFFVMNMDDVRKNDFGFSDQESSGSAQALLLKEEFYRTALKVAGKSLVWWLAPSGLEKAAAGGAKKTGANNAGGRQENEDRSADPKTYQRYAKLVSLCPHGLAARTADMGHMAEIPRSEFFGASLWQLVKAFKSPFKSIMKFGLLEKYIAGGGQGSALLCERIKLNMLEERHGLFATDPYAVLFKEVRDYYRSAGDAKAAGLVDLAFVLKITDGLGREDPTHASALLKARMLRETFPEPGLRARMMGQADGDFSRQVEMGKLVNAFMINTYEKVRQAMDQSGEGSTMDPADLTRMGRKLFAAFAKRKHKVERIPFVGAQKKGFGELVFLADKQPGKRPVWIARGLPAGKPSRRENYLEVKRDQGLAHLLAWIMVNRLYTKDVRVETDKSMAPVASRDLSELLPELYGFFPKKALETDLDETLKAERVTRVFYCLNLLAPRDQTVIRDAHIFYANNWGELFCLSTAPKGKDADVLRTDNAAFLARLVEQEVAGGHDLAVFIPRGSRCPKIVG